MPTGFYPDLPQVPIILPILLAIVACMFFGTLNGFLVAKYDMHPFIATLAVQVIVYGATSLYFDLPPNNSQPLGGIRSDFSALGLTKLGEIRNAAGQVVFPGISILVPIALVVLVIIWFVLNKTVFGKNVYAIGGNREAAGRFGRQRLQDHHGHLHPRLRPLRRRRASWRPPVPRAPPTTTATAMSSTQSPPASSAASR